MTVQGLPRQDWEKPNLVPGRAQARGPEPPQVQAWVQQACAPRASVRQLWGRRERQERQPEPPSFLPNAFWRWPSWLIFSGLPLWTSWRLSSPTSWPF